VWALLACGILSPGAALAWPVDVYVDVDAGGRWFQRLSTVDWVEVQDPKIATAEVLPSGELFVEGKSPGRTLLLAYAEGRFAVWRIRVAGKEKAAVEVHGAPALAQARKACPGLAEEHGSEGPSLQVQVKDEACRRALLQLFETDDYKARALELTFEVPALQAQLAAIERGLKAANLGHLGVRYAGAGLVLSGTATPEEHRRALLEIFRQSAGRVPLEDRVELKTTDTP